MSGEKGEAMSRRMTEGLILPLPHLQVLGAVEHSERGFCRMKERCSKISTPQFSTTKTPSSSGYGS